MNAEPTPLRARLRHARRPVWGALFCALLGVLLWPATVGMDLPLSSWTLRLVSAGFMLVALLLALQDLREHAGPLGPVLISLTVALLFPVLAWREITLEPMTMRVVSLVNLADNARIELSRSYQAAGRMPACGHPAIANLLVAIENSGHVSKLRCERPGQGEILLTLSLGNRPDTGQAPTLVLRYHGEQRLRLDCHQGTLAMELRPVQCQG